MKKIVTQFCDQCRYAKYKYKQYFILYESGEVRLELLEKIAPDFFRNLQIILKDDIFLNICKITDPACCGKRGNLTIKYILKQIESKTLEELKLNELSDKIHKFRDYIVEARNKIIGHLDCETITSNRSLGGFPKTASDDFWIDLQEFVNRIHKHYLDDAFTLDPIPTTDNAEDLVLALKKAAYFDQHFKEVLHSDLLEENQFRYRNA